MCFFVGSPKWFLNTKLEKKTVNNLLASKLESKIKSGKVWNISHLVYSFNWKSLQNMLIVFFCFFLLSPFPFHSTSTSLFSLSLSYSLSLSISLTPPSLPLSLSNIFEREPIWNSDVTCLQIINLVKLFSRKKLITKKSSAQNLKWCSSKFWEKVNPFKNIIREKKYFPKIKLWQTQYCWNDQNKNKPKPFNPFGVKMKK